jgi:hypothetical protein
MLLTGKIGNTLSNKDIEIFHILNSLSSFLQFENKVDEPSYQEDLNPFGPIIYVDSNTDYAYCIVDVIIGECCVVMYDLFTTIGNNTFLFSE